MRTRKCKTCGREFQAEKEQYLCPDCRSQALRDTVIRPRVCIQCGATFDGGPAARWCPDCRAARQKEQAAAARERRAAGKTRHIGSISTCVVCGRQYTYTGGNQVYCPDCASTAVRDKVLPKKRARSALHRAEQQERKTALKQDSAICAWCGKSYTSDGPSVTCSPDCAREYARYNRAMTAWRIGRRKTPPSREHPGSDLPQSGVTGVTYNRHISKWEVRHHGRYSGVFKTLPEALARQKELDSLDAPPEPETGDDIMHTPITLADAIDRAGISKSRLAREASVPVQTIRRAISGEIRLANMSARNVIKIAEVLDIDPRDLLAGESNRKEGES